ncbi:unnamed protein product [Zymoseptoria tritici ST99CH_1E4]|uniref:Uncharacterized protein n=1 Tax=Zymoseptoria tritici ST99CH_1E4 TaxID=1276532 RepID=A0A2H1FY62_ZYMTR|nr:unnamed protein product [Zymoseptoria tritici ST99CH_1E4]
MERLQHRTLLQAAQEGRFAAQDSELHIFHSDTDLKSSHEEVHQSACEEKDHLPPTFTSGLNGCNGPGSRLRLLLQRSRPPHTSGKPDSLPFASAASLNTIFETLNLPGSYLQIADGFLSTAQAHITYDAKGDAIAFQLIVYCTMKQGDWSLALSHHAATMETSIFLSLEQRLDSLPITSDLQDLQHYSFHPMLIPCIMFDAVMKMGIERRNSIKARLRTLERSMAVLSRRASGASRPGSLSEEDVGEEDADDWSALFELLASCRQDQVSRKGRYEFWKSYHAAIQAGMEYMPKVLLVGDEGVEGGERVKVHGELQQWVDLTWQRLNSLMARDKDHIGRVENMLTLLYSLVQQRDMSLQSSIAKATQRDSQDMKFIAVLGSVFLPASLVATILNVPEFQFLPGAKLFAAYVGNAGPGEDGENGDDDVLQALYLLIRKADARTSRRTMSLWVNQQSDPHHVQITDNALNKFWRVDLYS